MSSVFWYLGSPYSKFPGGLHRAHFEVCLEAARLIAAGIPVFSPISHTHPIAHFSFMDPLDHSIWLSADEPIMHAAHGIIVLTLDSWAQSFGLQKEIDWFANEGRPIIYMQPGVIPAELRKE